MSTKKFSFYLDEAGRERLRRLARREGRSQAEIVRAALAAYEARPTSDQPSARAGGRPGDVTAVADAPEEEMPGFGS